jgi:hypothetical protein
MSNTKEGDNWYEEVKDAWAYQCPATRVVIDRLFPLSL